MKQFLLVILSVCVFGISKAQTPQGINYQGVARNASGVELANQSIGLQLSVLDGSASGTAVYTETFSLTTDANGLFSIVIGNGTPSFGTFSAINWSVGGSKWLKTSMDITGGTSYQLVGTTQLMSVPYALYAENVGKNGGKQTVYLTDDITDAEAVTLIANEVGPNTQEVIITGTTALTTVDLSSITSLIYLEVSDNNALTSVNFSGLTKCAGSVIFRSNPFLMTIDISAITKISSGELRFEEMYMTSINMPALTRCGANMIFLNNNYLTALSFPALVSARNINIDSNGDLAAFSAPSMTTMSNFTANYNGSLNSINCAALTTAYNTTITDNFNLQTISMPVLATNNFLTITGASSITTLNMNSLYAVSYLTITGYQGGTLSFPVLTYGTNVSVTNSVLTSISFPSLANGGALTLTNNQLTVACINSLLNTLVSLNVVGGAYTFSGQTPAAAPTGQGVIDKATLITNGNTVVTD